MPLFASFIRKTDSKWHSFATISILGQVPRLFWIVIWYFENRLLASGNYGSSWLYSLFFNI